MRSGLSFFKPGTPARARRRRWIFVAFWSLAAIMLMWPVYPRFAGIEPLIIGLPLGLVWVISAILIVFFALLWLYLGEDR